MNWYLDAWKRYAQFSGRVSLEVFWMFFMVLPSAPQSNGDHYSQHGTTLIAGEKHEKN